MMNYLDLLDEYLRDKIFQMARIMYLKECHEKHKLFANPEERLSICFMADNIIAGRGPIRALRYTGYIRSYDNDASKREMAIRDYLISVQEFGLGITYKVYWQKRECPIYQGSIGSYIMMFKLLRRKYKKIRF